MEPIKSDILVDPKMAKEIMHRWNTWEQMRAALQASSEFLRLIDGLVPTVDFNDVCSIIADAILNAETRE